MMISHHLEIYDINQNGEKLYRKLMKEFFNLRWYIQHLVDEYEYQYGDSEGTNPLHESNWTNRINKKFMKYVNFTLKEMTPVLEANKANFPMCTLETLQKYCSIGSLLLTFC